MDKESKFKLGDIVRVTANCKDNGKEGKVKMIFQLGDRVEYTIEYGDKFIGPFLEAGLTLIESRKEQPVQHLRDKYKNIPILKNKSRSALKNKLEANQIVGITEEDIIEDFYATHG